MYLDKQALGESGLVGEELLTDAAYEIEQQCRAVQETVNENIFSLDEALEAYGVSQEAYSLFQLKNQVSVLQAKAYTHSASAAEYAFVFGALGNFFQVMYEMNDLKFLSAKSHVCLLGVLKSIDQIKTDFQRHEEEV